MFVELINYLQLLILYDRLLAKPCTCIFSFNRRMDELNRASIIFLFSQVRKQRHREDKQLEFI